MRESQNIIGLENTDYKTFTKDNKKDEFLKHIDNLVQNYFGDHVHHNLRLEFASYEGKTVCMIEVGQAGAPVFLKQKKQER